MTDDATLLASTQEKIRKFFEDLVEERARYNMYNAQKSKIMVVSRHNNISVQVDHEGESLEQVHYFKFLGSYKSADGDCTNEIKRRIASEVVWPRGPGRQVSRSFPCSTSLHITCPKELDAASRSSKTHLAKNGGGRSAPI